MSSKGENSNSLLKGLVVLLGLSTVGLLVSTIILATDDNSSDSDTSDAASSDAPASAALSTASASASSEPDLLSSKMESIFFTGEDDLNICKDVKKSFDLPNIDCIHVPGPEEGGNVTYAGPQAGGNVTEGYVGGLDVGDLVPNIEEYWKTSMCPVNVHWHLGTEHYSLNEYDEYGDGPHGNAERPDWARRDLEENVRAGFRCHHYDADDEKFTTEYDWEHCIGMEVGETYEVHWPHSSQGACGSINQYQTPFYDGVFCKLPPEVFPQLSKQDIANNVGVQGQIFTIVNDEKYFYPDLMRGMIKDAKKGYGQDIAYYTGSTTGTSRDNEMCSQYNPITWQVDRKCVMISASSFDKLCYDMKLQRDDMTDDLHAHGSRELVKTEFVANNQARHLWADGNGKLHPDEHYEEEEHNHDHGHHHHSWF